MAGATYAETLEAFTNFLTAYVHTLLYLRSIYPRTSFVHSRFHNTSAYQSRHPLVCDWIRDAVDAVRKELLDGTVSRIAIVIFSYGSGSGSGSGNGSEDGSGGSGSGGNGGSKDNGSVQIMERFMIDVSAFPVVDKDNQTAILQWGSRPSSQASMRSLSEDSHSNEAPISSPPEDPEQDHDNTRDPSPEPLAFDLAVDTNLAEQMRAALISLTTRCAALKPLPDKCSFNIAMELKDEADIDPPLAHPQAWMPVQPSLQKTGRKTVRRATVEDEHEEGDVGGKGSSTQESGEAGDMRRKGADLGGVRVTPIRTVETGTFRFETWVEEGSAKFGDARGGAQAKTKSDAGFAKPSVSMKNPKTSFSTSSGGSSTK